MKYYLYMSTYVEDQEPYLFEAHNRLTSLGEQSKLLSKI